MEDLYDPEEKILCPYNSSHHIRRCKMSFHLVKCKKNYGDVKMVRCDFNASHMIPEPELGYHHQICSDRRKIEAPIIESRSKNENRFPIANLNCGSDENWDNLDVPTYDPKSYAENNDILRHLDVESSAKRKNFRLLERQRLGGLSAQSNPPPAEPPQATVKLPAHRSVTNVDENNSNSSIFRAKLKSESNKLFLQYRSSSSKQ